MPQVRDCRRRDGSMEDMPLVTVKVGDLVGFKSDIEQHGVITKIDGDQLHLHNDKGFGGEYLRFAKDTIEHASDCWID